MLRQVFDQGSLRTRLSLFQKPTVARCGSRSEHQRPAPLPRLLFDVNPAPDRNPHLETAILEGGAHDRSIQLALEACEFFEIPEPEAREIIRKMAQHISDGWREALRQVGVLGALARDYKPAFVNDQMAMALDM